VPPFQGSFFSDSSPRAYARGYSLSHLRCSYVPQCHYIVRHSINNIIVTFLRDYLPQKPTLPFFIKGSGYSVFPSEVEELLHRHPAVAEVSVIGIPDAYRGVTPKAFIILKPEYKDKIKEEEIIDWTKDNMASYKRPRIIEFRDALPKSAAGKILKRAVVEEEKERVRSNKQTVT
jgi:hypothetical protein